MNEGHVREKRTREIYKGNAEDTNEGHERGARTRETYEGNVEGTQEGDWVMMQKQWEQDLQQMPPRWTDPPWRRRGREGSGVSEGRLVRVRANSNK